MDSHVVSGIGNIYASEALFHCGIHPQRAAGRVSRQRYARLADSVRSTLEKAIAAGGTSLRDFTREDGTPGYFRHQLQVYDRENLPCFRCKSPIRRRIIAQRSSYFCPQCQR
jgi:formamidopyrimidine-DNA glycosylase